MKLLNDIVALLMSEEGSLNEALLKTKVLLHEIGQRELTGWVTGELQGYKDGDDVPPYRQVEARVFGNLSNGFILYPHRPIPTGHMEGASGKSFTSTSMRQAVGVLEKFVTDAASGGSLTRQLGAQWDHELSKAFEGGFYVEGAYSSIPISQVRQILIEVRSRLLDFILKLRDEVGSSASPEEVKERATDLDVQAMFAGSVFGNNTTIVLGNGNNPQVTNTVITNDKSALAAELRKHGVAEEDIQALDVALSEDPAPVAAGQYGPAVQGWMKRMLGKAVDASWNVSIGAAGGVLGTVLQKYYGL